MNIPVAHRLALPVVPYATADLYTFGAKVKSRGGWVTHLGDDVAMAAGTLVRAIGVGRVVQAEIRPGSEEARNWGGIVVVAHQAASGLFYSVYGHLRNIEVAIGDEVAQGQTLGVVAERLTPENGWWNEPHLHFAMYIGPWRQGQTLPGYHRWWQLGRTKKRWWRDPRTFIERYRHG